MTESFTYHDMVCGHYGTAPEEKRIHIMDETEMKRFCAWRARAKMVSDYKRYLALNKRAMIVNRTMTRWDMDRELFRIYLRYAVKEEEFDQVYDELIYLNKQTIWKARAKLATFMKHLDPIVVKRLDRNLNIVYQKSYNYPEHWRARGYSASLSTLIDAKRRIAVAYKRRWCKKSKHILY
jgi:hypothetical protein